MVLSSGQLVFRYCSPPLFGMYWQRTVRNVLAVVPLRKDENALKDLVTNRIRLPSELDKLQENIKVLEGSVKTREARVLALKEDLKQNKPHSAEIRRHRTGIEALNDELIRIQSEISQKVGREKAASEAVTRAEKVEAEAAPKLSEIRLALKAYDELTSRCQDLRDLLADPRSEILIHTKATPALYPRANCKQIMAVSFLVSAICLFGLMIAFEMSSKS
jgi:DNA repair exonuclease SbcCD ATPase subunit